MGKTRGEFREYAYRLIHLMSAQSVYSAYQASQDSSNKNSPINALGKSAYETVKIESIVFLDKENKNSQKHLHSKNITLNA